MTINEVNLPVLSSQVQEDVRRAMALLQAAGSMTSAIEKYSKGEATDGEFSRNLGPYLEARKELGMGKPAGVEITRW